MSLSLTMNVRWAGLDLSESHKLCIEVGSNPTGAPNHVAERAINGEVENVLGLRIPTRSACLTVAVTFAAWPIFPGRMFWVIT